ncbi:hypothetical protein EWM64_g9886 [Hericium alpestre]|uniref:F-box domain-containing protein n=1 Tax=Hericium alpestre TaxID=135208 RepID=A0A4Y9ZHA4_9AGAM|nr:hypothetical protein EWM64_g9886 [Hericium alpestre]
MDGKGRSENLMQLHQDLEEAIAVVDAVKARINKLAPVARLPDELLSEIFSILADTQMPSWDLVWHVLVKRRPRPSRLGWMLVTHVCREWRRVAFGTPILWRRVTFSLGTQLAKRMLTHAGQVPLSITVRPMSLSLAPEVAYRINSQLSHIRALDVAAKKASLVWLVAHLREPAPVLQTLCLTSQSENFLGSVDQVIFLPPNICHVETPALLHLSLRNVFLPWKASLLSNLHTLSIVLPVFKHALDQDPDEAPPVITDRTWQPKITGLIETLESMPDLESLTIHGALPVSDDDILHHSDSRYTPKVTMPRLSHLDLKGSMEGVALLLAVLILPLDVDMRIASYRGDDRQDVKVRQLFDKIASHLMVPSSNHSHIPVTKLRITYRFPSITLQCRMQPKVSRSTTLEFQYMDCMFHASESEVLEELFSRIQFRMLFSLDVAYFDPYGMDADCWNELIGQCNYTGVPKELNDIAIRHARLNSTTFEGFAQFLLMGVVERRGKDDPLPNLPNLRTLEIHSTPTTSPTLLNLPIILEMRKKASAPLHKLVFDRFPIRLLSKSFLDKLKAVVPEVVVQNPTHDLD